MSGESKGAPGFSEEERASLRARAEELKAEASGGRGAKKAAADAAAVLKKIADMPAPDGALAARVHEAVTSAAPGLAPKLWYGQPAYARDGKVVCFFRSGQTDKERYSAFGFTPEAGLDAAGGMWPTAYALTEDLGEEGEAAIRDLVNKAVS